METLSEKNDALKILEKIIEKFEHVEEKPLVITEQLLKKELNLQMGLNIKKFTETEKEKFEPYAKEISSKIQIAKHINQKIDFKGDTQDFSNYFKNRFIRMKKILKKRSDIQNTVTIKEAITTRKNEEIKIIGMVANKNQRKNRIILEIEDLTASFNVLVSPKTDRKTFEEAENLLFDQIIGINAKKSRQEFCVAKNIILPDVPKRKPQVSNENVYVALLSDLHIGSETFLDVEFSHFISWLKGELQDKNTKNIAGKIKYLIIAGDLVDGIGIYPNQEKELSINNIYEQYRYAAELLAQIPEYIEIIIIPGNHDATRQALPQPAISKDYAKPLLKLQNIHLLENPSQFQLHGVSFLIYHGQSLDDIIGCIPGITYQNLNKSISQAMKHILRSRHLVPTYGKETQVVPESEDRLIIEEVPDILHMGHVHVFGYEKYRGITMINSGTWQKQTSFQKKKDVKPTPAILPIVNLKTNELSVKKFLI